MNGAHGRLPHSRKGVCWRLPMSKTEAPSAEDIRSAVNAYFDAVNGDDRAAIGDLFAAQGRLSSPIGADLIGRERILGFYGWALKAFPVHNDRPERLLIDGSSAAVVVHFGGSTASGAAIEFQAVDVFDFDGDGLIESLRICYDSHPVREHIRADRGR